METEPGLQALREFVTRYGDHELRSTGAKVVNYSGKLYNVSGSKDDPKIDGQNWKALLISEGIDADCYVADPLPKPTDTTSHPDFSVGGHMTANPDGSVSKGGTCYLMPLCYWHNSTSKNGIAFAHTQTKMLELSGYMEKDTALTFLARFPAKEPISVIYSDHGQWKQTRLSGGQADVKAALLTEGKAAVEPSHYVVFERGVRDGQTIYKVCDAHLNG